MLAGIRTGFPILPSPQQVDAIRRKKLHELQFLVPRPTGVFWFPSSGRPKVSVAAGLLVYLINQTPGKKLRHGVALAL